MMFTDHPFIERIRLERYVIRVVNKYCSQRSPELGGLSQQAIQHWFSCFPQTMREHRSLRAIREQLEYLGRFARISSNGSHRGAMVAPPPRKDIATKQITILEDALEKLFS